MYVFIVVSCPRLVLYGWIVGGLTLSVVLILRGGDGSRCQSRTRAGHGVRAHTAAAGVSAAEHSALADAAVEILVSGRAAAAARSGCGCEYVDVICRVRAVCGVDMSCGRYVRVFVMHENNKLVS